MKKLFTVLASMLMAVAMAFTVAGCGSDDKIDELTKRIEELERNSVVYQVNDIICSKTETMTIYFRNEPIYRIRLKIDDGCVFSGKGNTLTGSCYITSLCSDVYSSEIIGASYLKWDFGYFVLDISKYEPTILKKDKETEVKVSYNYYQGTSDYTLASMNWIDLIICVPGTHVELSRFKDVSYTLN